MTDLDRIKQIILSCNSKEDFSIEGLSKPLYRKLGGKHIDSGERTSEPDHNPDKDIDDLMISTVNGPERMLLAMMKERRDLKGMLFGFKSIKTLTKKIHTISQLGVSRR